MRKAIIVVTLTAVAMTLSQHAVLAGPLPTDDAAMAGWQGTQPFASSIFTALLKADVEYAVYAPGDFSSSAALGNPDDPSGGAQYVYAYQVLVGADANRPVSQLSVGFLDLPPQGSGVNNLEEPENVGSVAGFGSPDVAPSATFTLDASEPPVAQSAIWVFAEGGLSALDYSTILIYTSPFGPEWDRASILGAGLSNSQRMPSPTPEPGSLGLALLGGACFVLLRRARRRS